MAEVNIESKILERSDTFSLESKVRKNNKGFLKVPIRATRTGVLTYRDGHGNEFRELKHPQEVFKKSSMDTLNNSPITIHHPKGEMIDPENVSRLSVGLTDTDTKVVDGKYLDVTGTITHKKGINQIEDKKDKKEDQEVSCGYKALVVKQSGVYDGENYDYIQKDIKYNHIALVDAGRAGRKVKLILDDKNSFLNYDDKNKLNNSENKNNLKILNAGGDNMSDKIKITDKVETFEKELSEKKEVISGLLVKLDKLQGELDTLKSQKQKEDESKKNSKDQENLHDLLLERYDVVNIAKDIFDENEYANLELNKKSNNDIKKVIVEKELDVELSNKSDAYISASFDTIKSMRGKIHNQIDPLKIRASKLKVKPPQNKGFNEKQLSFHERSKNFWKEDLEKKLKG